MLRNMMLLLHFSVKQTKPGSKCHMLRLSHRAAGAAHEVPQREVKETLGQSAWGLFCYPAIFESFGIWPKNKHEKADLAQTDSDSKPGSA